MPLKVNRHSTSQISQFDMFSYIDFKFFLNLSRSDYNMSIGLCIEFNKSLLSENAVTIIINSFTLLLAEVEYPEMSRNLKITMVSVSSQDNCAMRLRVVVD